MNGKKLKNPTMGVKRTKAIFGKPEFNKGKSPLKGFKGVKKPALV